MEKKNIDRKLKYPNMDRKILQILLSIKIHT